MARKSRTGVLKRQREAKKAERAALERERQGQKEARESDGSRVATSDDLAGYGFFEDTGSDGEEETPPATESVSAAGMPRGPGESRAWPKSR